MSTMNQHFHYLRFCYSWLLSSWVPSKQSTVSNWVFTHRYTQPSWRHNCGYRVDYSHCTNCWLDTGKAKIFDGLVVSFFIVQTSWQLLASPPQKPNASTGWHGEASATAAVRWRIEGRWGTRTGYVFCSSASGLISEKNKVGKFDFGLPTCGSVGVLEDERFDCLTNTPSFWEENTKHNAHEVAMPSAGSSWLQRGMMTTWGNSNMWHGSHGSFITTFDGKGCTQEHADGFIYSIWEKMRHPQLAKGGPKTLNSIAVAPENSRILSVLRTKTC